VKIITDNISKNLIRDGIVVSARRQAEFHAVTQWAAWRSAFSYNGRRPPAIL
jgi:hypothetical protein